MSVNTLHPLITAERQAEWRLIRDCMDGEGAIKKQRVLYLPAPSGFPVNADGTSPMYDAYLKRAQFPEFLAPSVSAMIGVIHGQEIVPEIPAQMEYLFEDADGDGLPLEAFHRRITRELLVIGGFSVLTDAPRDGGDPYLVGHRRDKLINWDFDWYVLDETTMAREGFVWEQLEQYRVLTMLGGTYAPTLHRGKNTNGEPIEIRGRGGSILPRIPFVVASAVDLSPRVEAPPLIGVANAAKAYYQLSADYRHQLYMSGQETLVAINGDGPESVGAGVVHEMRGTEMQTPDLKYVSPSCKGIEAHKIAMDDARKAAVTAGARLFEEKSASQESGEAKRLRYASESATLMSVAQNSCLLLERALKNAAMIMGLPEDDIVVPPPKDLMDRTMSPQDFAALFGVYTEGGISWETLYENGQRGGIYSTERDAETEMRLLDGPVGEADAVV